MKRITIVWILFFIACGSEAQEEPCGGAYLAGTFTNVEVAALTDVVEAFEAVGLPEPCCLVTFIWAFDQPFRDTTWKDFRNANNDEPRNPAEGYRGLCDKANGVVYVRRFGDAEPFLHSLLAHEMLHLIGYKHGETMKAKEKEIKNARINH